VPAERVLRQPETRLRDLHASGRLSLEIDPAFSRIDLASVETTVKYEGYLKRQMQEINRAVRDERRMIPDDFRFDGVPGLSSEVVQRLTHVRPATVGHALRVPGVTPAAVAVIATYVSRHLERLDNTDMMRL
jgi:tRNA uridine 5-carboxymethylaminomethyl modification enzyme